ncbi:MAG: mechanosensitive ion channel protein MscS [Micavibrio aeruginosavorus]|uniref:Mechanosensitive ion channel protein MscS n=1 Tax=Micavibrio aeruginosavorus TaxID=349221 RepID=A0A2W5FLW9_9BACT|nr:MAG: mechanosensitive ion channel protein MscS [Micavibrio aeruginosavorus]
MEEFGSWRDSFSLDLNKFALLWEDRFLTMDALVQACIIGLSLCLSWLLATVSARNFQKWLDKRDRKYALHLNVSAGEIFFFLFLSVLLWAGVQIFSVLGYSYTGLKVLASLVTAWGLIRITSSTIKSKFWSRVIAVALWLTAALSILGLLEATALALDSEAITIGKVRLSPLLVIKGIAIFCLLLWILNFVSKMLEKSFNSSSNLTLSQKVLFYKLTNIFLYSAGIFLGLNIIGLDLTALAVFGGALGLGIGFGLQKIFSNLISGIILLMDKSVKPGDVIAIGDTYGWVNKLGARYVSVLTRDGKEHLIPNENLISEQVENWSYSDSNIRIHVPVGVSYNSDMHKVREVLLTAAKESPRILKDHPIVCLMKDFGDNSVNFELRAWIGDPQQGVSNIKSEIYFRIWDLFKENGIEIPFPQRDVHLKIDDELRNLLKKS